jgi:putative oxidoreductase
MAVTFLIGRLLLGGFFVMSGLHHFTDLATLSQFAAAKGVPAADVAILASGLLILFAGVSLILGWRPELGITAAVMFLVGVTFPMHNFWSLTDPAARAAEMGNFMKNTALVGATLMFVAIPQPWPYSVGVRRRALL